MPDTPMTPASPEPQQPQDAGEGAMELDELFNGRNSVYVLRVRGESMRPELHDGDYVTVERRTTARDGEQAVVLLPDGEAMLKRYHREPGGMVRLQPDNPKYQPRILPESDVKVRGVVIGVLRNYSESPPPAPAARPAPEPAAATPDETSGEDDALCVDIGRWLRAERCEQGDETRLLTRAMAALARLRAAQPQAAPAGGDGEVKRLRAALERHPCCCDWLDKQLEALAPAPRDAPREDVCPKCEESGSVSQDAAGGRICGRCGHTWVAPAPRDAADAAKETT